MPPISVGTSRFTLALETGQAKLWILLVGVNEYQDPNLPGLRYSAIDCQGLGDALNDATQAFPQKEIIVHHDLGDRQPILEAVKASLKGIVISAKTQDTVLFYFSGHGLLEPESRQTVLCLADTDRENLLNTGLTLQELLAMFSHCSAHTQVVWLDACHCGNMSLTGARGKTKESFLDNPTVQLLEALRHRAAKSKGFYALLSCDQGQQSWEFPDLGHGVFSYYLMRGLRGEAANTKGVIEADGLYRYVYNQTLQYIEKANHQLRVINQQKRHRGDPHLYSEYSLQTPKRIVEGVGELILGLRKNTGTLEDERRYALMVEGLTENRTSIALREVLQKEGQFTVEYLSTAGQQETDVRNSIQSFLQAQNTEEQIPSTLLLYLRGQIVDKAEGESYWVLQHGIEISRSWLRQELRRANSAQQIVILDAHGTGSLEEWIEELKIYADRGQCLLGAIAPAEDVELFAQILLESLIAANPQAGLSVAEWLTQLQSNCEQLGIALSAWLSGLQGVIDILPGKIEEIFPTPTKTEKVASVVVEETQAQDHFSSEQHASLTQFLMELVGPIALNLLQSVEENAANATALLDALAQYLSPGQKIALDRWASFMVRKTEEAPQPQTKEATDNKLSAEQYTQLESILKEIIGPIAPMLLAQMSEQFASPELLVSNLKDYLTPLQKALLEKKMVSSSATTEQSQPPTSPPPPPQEITPTTIDESFVGQCEQELTQIVGPIAHFIITTTLQDHSHLSRDELIEILAAQIPNANQSVNFRKRWTAK